jgi:hypothetical protein
MGDNHVRRHPLYRGGAHQESMVRQVGGVRVDSMASHMVNFLASIVLPAGLTFKIRTFTWTTGADGLAEVMEVVQAVTPQVFSSLIALYLHKHKHASFMLFYVVATNVIVFKILFGSHHVTLESWCN